MSECNNASTIEYNTDSTAKPVAVGERSEYTNKYSPPNSYRTECSVHNSEKPTLSMFNTDFTTNGTEYLALVSDTSSLVTTYECNPKEINYLLPVASSNNSVSNEVASISESDYLVIVNENSELNNNALFDYLEPVSAAASYIDTSVEYLTPIGEDFRGYSTLQSTEYLVIVNENSELNNNALSDYLEAVGAAASNAKTSVEYLTPIGEVNNAMRLIDGNDNVHAMTVYDSNATSAAFMAAITGVPGTVERDVSVNVSVSVYNAQHAGLTNEDLNAAEMYDDIDDVTSGSLADGSRIHLEPLDVHDK